MRLVKSKIAPNPKEVKYWVDLSADKYGRIIKIHNGMKWIPLSDGEGGSSNYNDLNNKPSINGVILEGNVEFDMSKYVEEDELASIIPEEYVTETELSNATYSKEEVHDIISNVEGTNAWNDVQ